MKTCTQCTGKHYAKGLCCTCYQKTYRKSDKYKAYRKAYYQKNRARILARHKAVSTPVGVDFSD